MKITPVILSGGSGTRLWPLSRPSQPKQFLKLTSNKSMFQKTALRASNKKLFNDLIIVGNNEHRFIIAEELENIAVKSETIILEPIAKNTAPAIAIAALEVFAKNAHGEDLMLVMPSDHIIEDEKGLLAAVKKTVSLANKNYFVTFGVNPTSPQINYGYIKKGKKINRKNIFVVDKFVEKPNLKTAKKFLLDTKFLWNSGIFLFKASTYLHSLRKNNHQTFINCVSAYNNSEKDLEFIRLNLEDFEKCENISADHAVMEQAENIAVIPIDVGWSDIGNWDIITDIGNKDDNGNNLIGDVIALKSKNCYINSEHGLITVVGVENLIIVALKDVVLVANKNNSSDITQLYEILKNQNREECKTHPKVYRPWGNAETINVGDGFKIKKITVKPGGSLSLQIHNHRNEHWVVTSGNAFVTCGDKEMQLTKDQSISIAIKEKHRLENRSKVNLEIIEIQTGDYLKEDDIIRLCNYYKK
ncbi:MAG: mannose-1-phosphate guanylyltransferase/mannose-6-phosphate isomerase [Pseudomonadota bacterium]